jgi:hypothetical protein
MPHMCCVVTASTALAPTAASAALPPARNRATPALEARWSTEATIPCGAYTVVPASEVAIGPPYGDSPVRPNVHFCQLDEHSPCSFG